MLKLKLVIPVMEADASVLTFAFTQAEGGSPAYSWRALMNIQNNGVSFRAYFYIIRFGKMIFSHRIRAHNKLYAHGLIENLR
jgi:hypothetical protein